MKLILPKNITKSLAYETGLHIGDGSMNYYSGHGLYSLRGDKIKDKSFFEHVIKPLYKYLYNADVRLRYWSDVFGFQLCSDELVDFKNRLGLPLGPKKNIGIPEIFMTDKSLYTSCLRGLIETDGDIYLESKSTGLYPRIEFSTTSELLASQVNLILNTLGFNFSSRMQTYSNGWLPIFRICLRGQRNLDKWIRLVGFNHPYMLEKLKRLDASTRF